MGIPLNATVAGGRRGNEWRLPWARSRNDHLIQLRSALMETVGPDPSKGEDCFFWKIENIVGSAFSTKNTWDEIRSSNAKVSWASSMWFKGCILKQAFTFWVCNLDRFPVNTRLAAWGITASIHCNTCSRFSETRNHLFLHCDFSSQVWYCVLQRLGHPPLIFSDWSVFMNCLTSCSRGTSSKLKKLAAQTTIFF